MRYPKVSVLMSVYNGENFLREAMESILNQTFTDFEFIIIDDSSTDRTKEIIKSYNDTRIRLIENNKNMGLTKSLNKGIDLCRGEYIARMDADDISYTSRLEKQVFFLLKNNDYAMAGSLADVIKGKDIKRKKWLHNTTKKELQYLTSDYIKSKLLFSNPFIHSSVMIRRKVIKRHKYDENFKAAQDYDLWAKIAKNNKVSIIKEALICYRLHEGQINAYDRLEQYNTDFEVYKKQLFRLGIKARKEELKLHKSLREIGWNSINKRYKIEDIEKWLKKIKCSNELYNKYNQSDLNKIIEEIWFSSCVSFKEKGIISFLKFFRTSIYKISSYSIKSHVKLFWECVKYV